MLLNIHSVTPEHEEIAIGCSLESLIYCYFKQIPFLYCRKDIPHEFDFLNNTESLVPFRIPFTPKSIFTIDSSKLTKPAKHLIWHRLFFVMTFKGYSLMTDECASLKIEGDTIKAFTPHARMSKIKFKKLIIFDDTKVHGLPAPIRNNNMNFKVYDWVNIRNCTTHPYDYLISNEDFVNEVIFFPSRRSGVEIPARKDLISVSNIKESNLDEYEYSDVAARFKTLYLMKQAGIRGAKNGKDMLDKTKTKYYALKIETVKRDIIPLTQLNIYSDTDQFKFNNKSYEQLLKEFEGIRSPFDNFVRDLNA